MVNTLSETPVYLRYARNLKTILSYKNKLVSAAKLSKHKSRLANYIEHYAPLLNILIIYRNLYILYNLHPNRFEYACS